MSDIKKRCDNCVHWGRANFTSYESDFPRPYKLLRVRECTAVAELWAATRWNEDGSELEIDPEYADTLAFAQDASDYSASLYTKPEFMCAMYKSRED